MVIPSSLIWSRTLPSREIIPVAKGIDQRFTKSAFVKIRNGNAIQAHFHFLFMIPCGKILCDPIKSGKDGEIKGFIDPNIRTSQNLNRSLC